MTLCIVLLCLKVHLLFHLQLSTAPACLPPSPLSSFPLNRISAQYFWCPYPLSVLLLMIMIQFWPHSHASISLVQCSLYCICLSNEAHFRAAGFYTPPCLTVPFRNVIQCTSCCTQADVHVHMSDHYWAVGIQLVQPAGRKKGSDEDSLKYGVLKVKLSASSKD